MFLMGRLLELLARTILFGFMMNKPNRSRPSYKESNGITMAIIIDYFPSNSNLMTLILS